MKKTYVSRASAKNFYVQVDGKAVNVEMWPRVINVYGLRGCSVTVEDEKIQDAIESSTEYCNGKKDQVWWCDIDNPKHQEFEWEKTGAKEAALRKNVVAETAPVEPAEKKTEKKASLRRTKK